MVEQIGTALSLPTQKNKILSTLDIPGGAVALEGQGKPEQMKS